LGYHSGYYPFYKIRIKTTAGLTPRTPIYASSSATPPVAATKQASSKTGLRAAAAAARDADSPVFYHRDIKRTDTGCGLASVVEFFSFLVSAAQPRMLHI